MWNGKDNWGGLYPLVDTYDLKSPWIMAINCSIVQ